MSNKNKEKGKYLEEYVANKFKKEFNLDSRDVHRAQASGVFNTEYGDLYFRKHSIIIECKNQNDVQLQRIFPKLTKVIFKFYTQMEKDHDKFKKAYPEINNLAFLVLTNTSNRLPRYVVIEEQHFIDSIHKNLIHSSILRDKIPLIKTKAEEKNIYFFVFILDDFISYINMDNLEF